MDKQIHILEEYKSRINRVFDYSERNLDQELSLEELAGVANFSKYHFHRIFYAMVGETIFQFIQRLRLEKAAALLMSNLKKSVTEISSECGFTNQASFARAFKTMYKMSASDWRKHHTKTNSNLSKKDHNYRKTDSNPGKAYNLSSGYIKDRINDSIRRIDMKEGKVTLKDWPETTIAYVRHIGPYKGNSQLFDKLFNKLFSWAGPRNLLNFPQTQVLTIYHDNPEITDEAKLRVSVCITVPQDTKVEGEIGKTSIPAGRYAHCHFELTDQEYQAAWNWVYGVWLPGSGYQPDDRPCFELYLNDPKTHPEHKTQLDICVPVKPL